MCDWLHLLCEHPLVSRKSLPMISQGLTSCLCCRLSSLPAARVIATIWKRLCLTGSCSCWIDICNVDLFDTRLRKVPHKASVSILNVRAAVAHDPNAVCPGHWCMRRYLVCRRINSTT